MNLIAHLVAKDVRFLRYLWAAWAGLVAAQIGIVAKFMGPGLPGIVVGLVSAACAAGIALASFLLSRQPPRVRAAMLEWIRGMCGVGLVGLAAHAITPYSADLRNFELATLFYHLVGAIWVILAYLLGAATGMQDPPVGTKMFWATRPISGSTLLTAKAAGILLLFVAAPAVIWAPWRLQYGGAAGSFGLGSLVTMAWSGTAAFAGLFMASLAGDGRRFLVYNLVAVGVLLLFAMSSASAAVAEPMSSVDPLGLGATRLLAALAIAMGSAAAVLYFQYRFRRRGLTMGVLAAGSVLTWAAAEFFPVDLTHRGQRAAFAPNAELTDLAIQLTASGPERVHGMEECHVRFRLKGVPAAVYAESNSGLIQFTWAGGASSERFVRQYHTTPDISGAIQSSIGLAPGAAVPPNFSAMLFVDEALAERIRQGGTTARIRLYAEFKRPTVVQEVKPEVGARMYTPGAYARLLSVEVVDRVPSSSFINRQNVDVTKGPNGTTSTEVSDVRPETAEEKAFRGQRPNLVVWAGIEGAPNVQTSLCFISRGAKPFAINAAGNTGTLQFSEELTAFESVTRSQMVLPAPLESADKPPAVPSGWLDHTTIGFVRFERVGYLRDYLSSQVSLVD